jgi:hypothetical protein
MTMSSRLLSIAYGYTLSYRSMTGFMSPIPVPFYCTALSSSLGTQFHFFRTENGVQRRNVSMKALVYTGKGTVAIQDRPQPTIYPNPLMPLPNSAIPLSVAQICASSRAMSPLRHQAEFSDMYVLPQRNVLALCLWWVDIGEQN